LLATLTNRVDGLAGRGATYGEIAYTYATLLAMDSATRNSTILAAIQAGVGGAEYTPTSGDLVYDLGDSAGTNSHEWEYNETNWVDNGVTVAGKASDLLFGLVKGGLAHVNGLKYTEVIGGEIHNLLADKTLGVYDTTTGLLHYTYEEIKALEDRLDAVEPVVESNTDRLDIVEPIVTDHEERLDVVEPVVAEHESEITILQADIAEIDDANLNESKSRFAPAEMGSITNLTKATPVDDAAHLSKLHSIHIDGNSVNGISFVANKLVVNGNYPVENDISTIGTLNKLPDGQLDTFDWYVDRVTGLRVSKKTILSKRLPMPYDAQANGWAKLAPAELIVNGVDWTDSNSDGLADNWVKDSTEIASITNGKQRITADGDGKNPKLYSNLISHVIGHKYLIKFDITVSSVTGYVSVQLQGTDLDLEVTTVSYSAIITGTTNISTYLRFYFLGGELTNDYFELDNVSIKDVTALGAITATDEQIDAFITQSTNSVWEIDLSYWDGGSVLTLPADYDTIANAYISDLNRPHVAMNTLVTGGAIGVAISPNSKLYFVTTNAVADTLAELYTYLLVNKLYLTIGITPSTTETVVMPYCRQFNKYMTVDITSSTASAPSAWQIEYVKMAIETAPSDTEYGVREVVNASSPTLERVTRNGATMLVGANTGLSAEAGIDTGVVTNSFDAIPIFTRVPYTDANGNVFTTVKKYYIKEEWTTESEVNYHYWWMCATQLDGYRLPLCFVNEDGTENSVYYIGKYEGSITSTALESKTAKVCKVSYSRASFRTAARLNDGLGIASKYQITDVAEYVDLVQIPMMIEFATKNLQSIMRGFTEGSYTNTHLPLLAETAVNRVILTNAQAGAYRVGQMIDIGTSQGGRQVAQDRQIVSITVDTPVAGQSQIVFDGAAITTTLTQMVYNVSQKTGQCDAVVASSGSKTANDGKNSCIWRGMENPYGNTYKNVDGVKISNNQTWICLFPSLYNDTASVAGDYASPFVKLSYININANGYCAALGYDPLYPFAKFPTSITGGSSALYFSDYHYQNTGDCTVFVGGTWYDSSNAGPFCWYLGGGLGGAGLGLVARLSKRP
jgi:hypothetical protein